MWLTMNPPSPIDLSFDFLDVRNSDDTIRGNNGALASPPAATPTPSLNKNTTLTSRPSQQHIRRRRSSLLERWIHDQQSRPSTPTSDSQHSNVNTDPASPSAVGTPCNPYLAYPQLSGPPLSPNENGDASSVHSYDVVDDDDIPDMEKPSAPYHITMPPSSPGSLHARKKSLVPSIYTSDLSVRSASPTFPAITATSSSFDSSSRRKTTRLRSRSPGTPQTHVRARTLSTFSLSPLGATSTAQGDEPPPISNGEKIRTSSWRWRPGVLGHLSSHSVSVPRVHVSAVLQPPRHSSSSMMTRTTASFTPTMTSLDAAEAHAEKMSIVSSLRSRITSPFKSSSGSTHTTQSPSPSVWSLPMHQLQTASLSPSASSPVLASAASKQSGSMRLPFSSKTRARDEGGEPDVVAPRVAYAAKNTLSRVSFSSQRRKKKLVVNGIGPHETVRFENLKRWCESFGEVSQILRMSNGELHVHFKKAEVADTVCRVRAKVYISGVGSVYLSWYTGNRP